MEVGKMQLELIVKRREALKGAREAWKQAPAHVKLMAGAYVGPLLTALDALGEDLEEVQRDLHVADMARGGAAEGVDHGA